MILNSEDKAKIDFALEFCKLAHKHQKRRYTGVPYSTHPINVAGLIQRMATFWTVSMVIAALLHDVVEETDIKPHMIYTAFGKDAGDYVVDLTDLSVLEDGNRATRKAKNRIRIAASSPGAKTIKLADIADNLVDILNNPDEKFINLYYQEKRMDLQVLKQGDPTLYALVEEIINKRLGKL